VNLIYDPRAEDNYQLAIDFYESRDSKAAQEFVKKFEETEDRIVAAPDSYAFMAPELRSLRVPGFPYSIVYRYSPAELEIFVVAVWQLNRHPGFIRERLSPE